MKIGLYFGSFNPVHHGHLIIARHLINETDLQEVWMMVSPQNPFKSSNGLLNEHHRYHLVQTALDDESKIKASNIEFRLPKPSYTVNTLTYLKEKYPQHNFSIVLGSDGFQNIDKWHNAAFILKHYPIYIYVRPGFEIRENFGANTKILNAPLLEISSTHIRKLIRENKSIRYLVPDAVRTEIEKNNYYKTALENPTN
ncbi:MAG: nicotinate-nucleotide adenylyltransferase [Chitinophagaceae bacterium]|nr:MAG: nicotinate-nucleotide adenylyltransferase [Chitinophagaceae bacterium]